MSATYLQDSDPVALLLIALAVVLGAVMLSIAAYRRRRKSPRGLRPVTVDRKLDVVVRDIDRMAESVVCLSDSDPEAWQAFEHGLAAMAACRWGEAIQHFAAARARTAGPQLAPMLNQAGVCRYMQGRLGDALQEFQESARLAEWREDKKGRALALNNIGVIRHEYGELDLALEDLREARTLARESGDQATEGLCLGNIGNVLRDMEKPNAALRSQEDALAMARRTGDLRGVASCLGNIGSIMRVKGDPDQALARYGASLEAARKIDYKLGTAVVLGNIGGLYRDKGETERALQSHESALALAHDTGHRLCIAAELGNIGLILVGKHAYAQAVRFLAESLTFFVAAGATNGPRQGLYGLSRCDDALGRDQMQELLQRAGLAGDAIADAFERVDQIRSRRPWQKGIQHNPFAPVPAAPQLSGA